MTIPAYDDPDLVYDDPRFFYDGNPSGEVVQTRPIYWNGASTGRRRQEEIDEWNRRKKQHFTNITIQAKPLGSSKTTPVEIVQFKGLDNDRISVEAKPQQKTDNTSANLMDAWEVESVPLNIAEEPIVLNMEGFSESQVHAEVVPITGSSIQVSCKLLQGHTPIIKANPLAAQLPRKPKSSS